VFGLVVDDLHGLASIEHMQRAIDEPATLLLSFGEVLLESHRERIAAGVSPDGTPFHPLSKAYKARKPRNKDKVLILDGYLHDLLRYSLEGHTLYFGSDRVYAATMHYGDEARGIPARNWLGLSRQDIARFCELVHDHLRPPGGVF
jgi:phage virion morphogenesis protein